MYKRKSAVDLTDLAVGLLILGIVVAIGARMLLTYRDNRLTDLSLVTTTNESVTVSSTGSELTNVWGNAVTRIYNGTIGTEVSSGNYSTSISDLTGKITITNTTSEYSDGGSWAATYTWYNTTNPQWDLPNDAAIGVGEYGNWFDIIVIVGIAGLILSIIFLAFGRQGQTGVSY